ncbi:ribulose-5-phosphate 4-epimerase/fuculose-1-phosphate aldolase [Geomicrobium halophilum]|uniref:Ribulose-5-phosphate 4-epimerase/fuculose-1-phosphate aldolase n=1 Tax=Geomicrobium halophilum TaxID=549000 RepID=A0A841PK53_9BACL|nr:class II aldolase/adducin family protein [Geomicrobium halophilum]MBB6449109.1 ribulose-5-phosphate 4-epimerase/fuculose-1-phosphate aldolase [Geomicrobium halophilum]
MKNFTVNGKADSPFLTWLTEGVIREFQTEGYQFQEEPGEDIKLVLNVIEPERPRHFRRKAQSTFVVTIVETEEEPEEVFKAAYPLLIRSLANHLMFVSHSDERSMVSFLTPEQGIYQMTYDPEEDENLFFQRIYERLEPLASSQLVINNDFYDDLYENLVNGNGITKQMFLYGKKLDDLNLLPAPFPLEEYLSSRDMRHLKKLYGLGGLSYGNLSSRENTDHFWMSASGIDKSNMKDIGRDILYITGYDEVNNSMKIRIPPKTTPRRASVDAIEHWMIYREHPDVGAIVHIHAWMDGIEATQTNYPCGTLELAETVAELVRQSEDPSRTVIGLKNHGLTITGTNLDDIFERIEGRVIPQIPML